MTGREILAQKGVDFEGDWIDDCPSTYGLKDSLDICKENGDSCEECIRYALDREYK